MPKTLTTSEIAEKFGVSAVTALNWCNSGLFPNAKKVFYPRGEIWEIPLSDTKNFTPPQRGRPADPNPSQVTIAKRRSRPLKNVKKGEIAA
jgi:hypothetical protein